MDGAKNTITMLNLTGGLFLFFVDQGVTWTRVDDGMAYKRSCNNSESLFSVLEGI